MLQELKVELKLSLLGHLLSVGALLFVGFALSHFFRPAGENLIIAQRSVRVDVVAMPKLTFKELQHIDLRSVKGVTTDDVPAKVESAAAQIPEQAPDDGKNFQVLKKKEDFLSMLKDHSKKESSVEKTKNPPKKPNISSKLQGELEQIILAGNKLSKGVAITGDIIEQENSALVNYLEALPDIIRPFWKLPTFFQGRDLRCRIRIYVGKNGKVLRREIFESSGDREYDRTAMEAVERASPLPALPPEILSRIINNGIILGFPL